MIIPAMTSYSPDVNQGYAGGDSDNWCLLPLATVACVSCRPRQDKHTATATYSPQVGPIFQMYSWRKQKDKPLFDLTDVVLCFLNK
jgi:hypothetical protein